MIFYSSLSEQYVARSGDPRSTIFAYIRTDDKTNTSPTTWNLLTKISTNKKMFIHDNTGTKTCTNDQVADPLIMIELRQKSQVWFHQLVAKTVKTN